MTLLTFSKKKKILLPHLSLPLFVKYLNQFNCYSQPKKKSINYFSYFLTPSIYFHNKWWLIGAWFFVFSLLTPYSLLYFFLFSVSYCQLLLYNFRNYIHYSTSQNIFGFPLSLSLLKKFPSLELYPFKPKLALLLVLPTLLVVFELETCLT